MTILTTEPWQVMLWRMREQIRENLSFDLASTQLIASRVINIDDYEELRELGTNDAKVTRLLDNLISRGTAHSFNNFLQFLLSDYDWLGAELQNYAITDNDTLQFKQFYGIAGPTERNVRNNDRLQPVVGSRPDPESPYANGNRVPTSGYGANTVGSQLISWPRTNNVGGSRERNENGNRLDFTRISSLVGNSEPDLRRPAGDCDRMVYSNSCSRSESRLSSSGITDLNRLGIGYASSTRSLSRSEAAVFEPQRSLGLQDIVSSRSHEDQYPPQFNSSRNSDALRPAALHGRHIDLISSPVANEREARTAHGSCDRPPSTTASNPPQDHFYRELTLPGVEHGNPLRSSRDQMSSSAHLDRPMPSLDERFALSGPHEQAGPSGPVIDRPIIHTPDRLSHGSQDRFSMSSRDRYPVNAADRMSSSMPSAGFHSSSSNCRTPTLSHGRLTGSPMWGDSVRSSPRLMDSESHQWHTPDHDRDQSPYKVTAGTKRHLDEDFDNEITEEMINFVAANHLVMRKWESLAHQVGMTSKVETIKYKIRMDSRDLDDHVKEFLREWKEAQPGEATLRGLVRLLRSLSFNNTAGQLEDGTFKKRARTGY